VELCLFHRAGPGAGRANARRSGGLGHLSTPGGHGGTQRSAPETIATVAVRSVLAVGNLGAVSGPHRSPAGASQRACVGLVASQRAIRPWLGEPGAVGGVAVAQCRAPLALAATPAGMAGRRLAVRAGSARVVVGLWGAGSDPGGSFSAPIPADRVVTDFHVRGPGWEGGRFCSPATGHELPDVPAGRAVGRGSAGAGWELYRHPLRSLYPAGG